MSDLIFIAKGSMLISIILQNNRLVRLLRFAIFLAHVLHCTVHSINTLRTRFSLIKVVRLSVNSLRFILL